MSRIPTLLHVLCSVPPLLHGNTKIRRVRFIDEIFVSARLQARGNGGKYEDCFIWEWRIW